MSAQLHVLHTANQRQPCASAADPRVSLPAAVQPRLHALPPACLACQPTFMPCGPSAGWQVHAEHGGARAARP